MAKLNSTTISRRTVERLEADRDTVYWDSELLGFGVRVYPTGRKVYVVQTRADGKDGKRVTVGRHGVITAEEARRRAAHIISRIKAGEDPIPEPLAAEAKGPTVAELAAKYLEEVVAVRLKPASAYSYRNTIEKHILPALGRKRALSLDHAAVSAFHHSLGRTPAAANRAVEMLFRIYRAAEERETIPEGSNPCRQVAMNRQRRHERFLTDEEFRRLGRVLDEVGSGRRRDGACGGGDPAAAADRLPQGRGAEAALGRCRPRGAGDAAARREDGSPDGAAVAGRGGGAGAGAPGRGQSACRAGHAAGEPHVRPAASLGADQEARRAGRTCGFTTAGTLSPRGRWRSARACRRSASCSVTAI